MFVSRARYAEAVRRAENAEAVVATLSAIVAKLTEPKPEAKPEPAPTYEAPPIPAGIIDAVDELHLSDGERMKLLGWARRQISEGKKVDLIVDTLRYGEPA